MVDEWVSSLYRLEIEWSLKACFSSELFDCSRGIIKVGYILVENVL